MRYLFIICGFLLHSCYTEKTAQKELIEAKLKKPDVVSKFVSENYPCDSVTIRVDTIEKVKWRLAVDSLKRKIIIKRDTINKILHDTIVQDCDDKVNKLKAELKDSYEFIDGLQETLNREVPVVYKWYSVKDTALIQSKNFEIDSLKKYKDLINEKRISLFWWVIILLILFGISLILHIVRK
jgi:uncharacterized lipoprotein YehR (DUF1307 family)